VIIITVEPNNDFTLAIKTDDGKKGIFDVRPYLNLEAFQELKILSEFNKITNGKYYIEWACGADLSADTIEAKLVL